MFLYIVATPIGNLSDITDRAREVLRSVKVVFAEDTRRASILLHHLDAHPRLLSYHHHTSPAKLEGFLRVLEEHDAALISDAGTPGVNDPGGVFVAAAVKRFDDDLKIVPIPGASALIVAASISGFPMDVFSCLGFPPHKKGRQTFFDRIAANSESVIFYESPYRIRQALQEIARRQPSRHLVVCRELTKRYETIYRDRADVLSERLNKEAPKGEYVVVVAPVNY